MRLFTLVAATFALLATPILSAPATAVVEVEKYKGQVKEGSYIVKLKNSVSKTDHLTWLSKHLDSDTVTHKEWEKKVLNGFAGRHCCLSVSRLNTHRLAQNRQILREDAQLAPFQPGCRVYRRRWNILHHLHRYAVSFLSLETWMGNL